MLKHRVEVLKRVKADSEYEAGTETILKAATYKISVHYAFKIADHIIEKLKKEELRYEYYRKRGIGDYPPFFLFAVLTAAEVVKFVESVDSEFLASVKASKVAPPTATVTIAVALACPGTHVRKCNVLLHPSQCV